jgi:hypothetical protein
MSLVGDAPEAHASFELDACACAGLVDDWMGLGNEEAEKNAAGGA